MDEQPEDVRWLPACCQIGKGLIMSEREDGTSTQAEATCRQDGAVLLPHLHLPVQTMPSE